MFWNERWALWHNRIYIGQDESGGKSSEREWFEKILVGFPVGPVVENLLANAGDTRPGRSHMPRGNSARVPQLLKPTRLEPLLCDKRSHHNEQPAHLNQRVAPTHPNERRAMRSKKALHLRAKN